MKETPEKLVDAAKHGDAQAFALLYQEIYTDLYRFALCTVRNPLLAEDIVSDSVLTAYENIHKLRSASAFRSWIFQITANQCKRQLRQQSRSIPVEQLPEAAEPSENADPSDHLALLQALETLSEKERLVITLSAYAGYSGKEIARYLRMKEGTVRSMKSRAFEKLRTHLNTIE